MLDPIRTEIAAAPVSSTEAVARALAALTPADLLRLKRMALLRALDGSRRWPENVPLLAFIAGIMRSLVDARAQERRCRAERALASGETLMAAPPDARLHARECLVAIARFFAGDPDVLALIAALARQYLGEGEGPAPRLSKRRREAARKRLARAIL